MPPPPFSLSSMGKRTHACGSRDRGSQLSLGQWAVTIVMTSGHLHDRYPPWPREIRDIFSLICESEIIVRQRIDPFINFFRSQPLHRTLKSEGARWEIFLGPINLSVQCQAPLLADKHTDVHITVWKGVLFRERAWDAEHWLGISVPNISEAFLQSQYFG